METSPESATVARPAGLLFLAILALIVGALGGLIGACFRLVLVGGDHLRDSILVRAHSIPIIGFPIVIVGGAVAAGLAAWLVVGLSPQAKGSGIPSVEAVLAGEKPPAPLLLLPVKFLGGALAMGVGLALGREGPSVQMGASIGHFVGDLARCNQEDAHALLAAGAGAGLATAFNAPIAGAVFVLEELVRRFDTRITVVTLGASASAIAVARVFLGDAPDFQVPEIPFAGMGAVPFYLMLGVVMGVLGVIYNQAILGSLALMKRLTLCPVAVRAALVGAGVALAAWWAPNLVGGGEVLTQRTLTSSEAPGLLTMALLFRLALGAVSYAAGTPGGLFAPLLAVGAQGGLLLGILFQWGFAGLAPPPTACAVVGMAALFTAVVRAPVTGIVLIVEMVSNFPLLLPMLLACFAAMALPTLLGVAPIYDSLREPAAGLRGEGREARGEKNWMFLI